MKHRDGESPANDGFNSYGANVAPWKKWDVIVFFTGAGYSSMNRPTNGKRIGKGTYALFQCCSPSLVGGIPTPLTNMSSSMGRMTSHIL